MRSFSTRARRPGPIVALLAFLRRENLFRLIGVIVVLVLVGAAGLTYFEDDRPFHDALWWAIVTLTTVGFGDISPASLGGRLIGVVLMFFGIGVLGTFTATIAGAFVEQRQRKDRGMGEHDLEGHIILCGWNDRTKEILKDLRADKRSAGDPIALVADIQANPASGDDHLHFVRGTETEDDLKRAGIEKAKTVVLVGDRSLDYGPRDAKAVLAVADGEGASTATSTPSPSWPARKTSPTAGMPGPTRSSWARTCAVASSRPQPSTMAFPRCCTSC